MISFLLVQSLCTFAVNGPAVAAQDQQAQNRTQPAQSTVTRRLFPHVGFDDDQLGSLRVLTTGDQHVQNNRSAHSPSIIGQAMLSLRTNSNSPTSQPQ